MQSILVVSQLPILLIFSYVYFRDRNAKAPLWALVMCFLFGALSGFLAVAIGMTLGPMEIGEDWSTGYAFWFFMINVALVEEACKLSVIKYFAFRLKSFAEPFDGLLFSAASALGFASLENLLYTATMGLDVGMWRMFTAVPMHAACGIVGGYYLGLAKFAETSRTTLQIRALAIATVSHGLYDFFCYIEAYPLIVISLVVLVVAARRAIRFHTHIQDMGSGVCARVEDADLFGFHFSFRTLPLTFLVWFFFFLSVTATIAFLFEDTDYLLAASLSCVGTYFLYKLREGLIAEHRWASIMTGLLYLLLIATPMCIFAIMGIIGMVFYESAEQNKPAPV